MIRVHCAPSESRKLSIVNKTRPRVVLIIPDPTITRYREGRVMKCATRSVNQSRNPKRPRKRCDDVCSQVEQSWRWLVFFFIELRVLPSASARCGSGSWRSPSRQCERADESMIIWIHMENRAGSVGNTSWAVLRGWMGTWCCSVPRRSHGIDLSARISLQKKDPYRTEPRSTNTLSFYLYVPVVFAVKAETCQLW